MWAPQTTTDNEETRRRRQAREDFLRGLPQAEEMARSRGVFFNSMEDIWELERVAITDDDSFFRAICRTEEQGNVLYAQITSKSLSYPMSQSESSSVTNTAQQSPSRFDMFQNDTAEKAHLFSDAPVCHKAYGYLAQAPTGIQAKTPEERLKLLNGVKKTGNSRRSRGTGLKHHKLNKMYLERQKDYYDNQPVLVLIPIYGINDVLNWNGTDEYDVMAITYGGSGSGPSCSKKVLEASPSTCTQDDIEIATELLRVFYKGIACSVRNHSVGESFTREQLDFHSTPMTDLKKWWKLKKEALESDEASIQIPKVKNDLEWDKVKVARARASRQNSLPDPFNMAVKAAINFSCIVGAKVMPACPEDGMSDDDEPINSTQDEDDDVDDSQRAQRERNLDLSSLLRPVQSVM